MPAFRFCSTTAMVRSPPDPIPRSLRNRPPLESPWQISTRTATSILRSPTVWQTLSTCIWAYPQDFSASRSSPPLDHRQHPFQQPSLRGLFRTAASLASPLLTRPPALAPPATLVSF